MLRAPLGKCSASRSRPPSVKFLLQRKSRCTLWDSLGRCLASSSRPRSVKFSLSRKSRWTLWVVLGKRSASIASPQFVNFWLPPKFKRTLLAVLGRHSASRSSPWSVNCWLPPKSSWMVWAVLGRCCARLSRNSSSKMELSAKPRRTYCLPNRHHSPTAIEDTLFTGPLNVSNRATMPNALRPLPSVNSTCSSTVLARAASAICLQCSSVRAPSHSYDALVWSSRT
mmetsp:Transcript_88631/g.240271  ORF Transcript_88631/g.240271 Transcript_88631/m.240271 type:complete len:226 (-) Transcript_88631:462-1139(-)